MSMPDGGLASLAEDLILLSIRPHGDIPDVGRLDRAVMGSELVRLAAAGRVIIIADTIHVEDAAPAGDPDLDAALADITALRAPRSARWWMAKSRRKAREGYLGRLIYAGVLVPGRGSLFGARRYKVTAPDRVAEARARLDAIASSAGWVDVTAAALAGLACAAGLDRTLYYGWPQAQERLRQVGQGRWTASPGSVIPGAPVAGAAAPARAAAWRDGRDTVLAQTPSQDLPPGSALASHGPPHRPAHDAAPGPTHAAPQGAAHGAPQGAASAAAEGPARWEAQGAASAAAQDAASAGAQGAAAAAQGATQAAAHAATHAATQAATSAAVHAATHAAVQAATHAAVAAAHHASGSGGGHHGAGGGSGGGHSGGHHGGGGGGGGDGGGHHH